MRSDEGRELGDGRHTVFLSAGHWAQLKGTAPHLSQVLHYIATDRLPDEPCGLVRRIDELVDELSDDERVSRMMTYEQQIKISEARGIEQGRAEGKAEGLVEGTAKSNEEWSRLIKALLGDKRYEEAEKVADDPELRAQLIREYGILVK